MRAYIYGIQINMLQHKHSFFVCAQMQTTAATMLQQNKSTQDHLHEAHNIVVSADISISFLSPPSSSSFPCFSGEAEACAELEEGRDASPACCGSTDMLSALINARACGIDDSFCESLSKRSVRMLSSCFLCKYLGNKLG